MDGFFFSRILPLTLAGSAASLALMMLSPLQRRLGSRWLYRAWTLAPVLFVLPCTLPEAARNTSAVPPFAGLPPIRYMGAALEAPAVEAASGAAVPWGALVTVLWAVGAVVFLLPRLRDALRFSRALAGANIPAGEEARAALAACAAELGVRRKIPLRVCPLIGSPMLTGVLRPRITLPDIPIGEAELRLVLLHELTHYRGGDLPYKLAALLVNAVQWFNPLAWLARRRIDSLCELACDESLARRMGREERRDYGMAILRIMGEAKLAPPVSTAFSLKKEDLKSLQIKSQGENEKNQDREKRYNK